MSLQSSWNGTKALSGPNGIQGVCLILDKESLRAPAGEALSQALDAGVRFFQYRSKMAARRAIFDEAAELARAARGRGALFIVNDHADIAVAAGADGVHLGQDDLPLAAARRLAGRAYLIGISTHSLEQAMEAQAAGADYIGFGPVFPSATKDAGRPRGLDELREVCRSASIPVIAIGGINHDNAAEAMRAGAAGIAVISSILSAANPVAAAKEMVRIVAAARS